VDVAAATPAGRGGVVIARALFVGGVSALIAAGAQLEASWWVAFGLFLGVEAADLASGLFHWSIDNYGSGDTKPRALGEIIAEFQGHQATPRDIVAKGLCEVSFPGGRIVVPLLVIVAALGFAGFAGAVLIGFFGSVFFGQVLHKWSHQPPPLVAWLQRVGLMLSQRTHVAHHGGGHSDTYAIITGHTNCVLDRFVLPRLERAVQAWFGRVPHWRR
jgi:ubiquitin-conjugating enzyme E2 variant